MFSWNCRISHVKRRGFPYWEGEGANTKIRFLLLSTKESESRTRKEFSRLQDATAGQHQNVHIRCKSWQHSCTCSQTHTQRHICTHTQHIHECTHKHTDTQRDTPIHAHVDTQTHTERDRHTHAHRYTCMHTERHTYTHAYKADTHTHSYTHSF